MPSPEESVLGRGLAAESWTFDRPLAGFGQPVPADVPHGWGPQVTPKLVARGAEHTRAMRCMARELSRFINRYLQPPAPYLNQALARRCGTVADQVSLGWVIYRQTSRSSVEELAEQAAPQVNELVDKLPASGPFEVGIELVKSEGAATLVVAFGRPQAVVRRFEVVSGRAHIEGEVAVPAAQIAGAVTRGAQQVASCRIDKSIALPSFKAACPLNPGDDVVRIDFSARQQGRYLGSNFLKVDFALSGKMPPILVERSKAATVPTAEDLADALNAVRRNAGLKPLKFERRQSETSQEVANAYFGAIRGFVDPRIADHVALGLQAGYDVESPIRYAGFGSFVAFSGANARAVVQQVSQRPSFREVFLDPNADRVALGVVADPSSKTLGIIGTSYVGPGAFDREQLRTAVVSRLMDERKSRQQAVPRLTTFGPRGELDRQLAQLEAGHASVELIANAMAQRAAENSPGQRFQVHMLEVSRLEDLEFPQPVLQAPNLELEVALFKPPGEPWHRYLVLVVCPQTVTT